MTKPPRLGDEIWMVLGGGGLKGLAHVGAWRVVTEAGIQVRGIVGTSTGALVGALIAGGAAPDRLEELARSLSRDQLARLNRRAAWLNGIRQESVFQGEVLREYIDEVLPVRSWDELRIPLLVNAVGLGTGEPHWFGPGARLDVPLAEAVYASAALPVFYPPARIGEEVFVDGGTDEVLALGRAAAAGASGLIAIDLAGGEPIDPHPVVEKGMIAIYQRVFSIMTNSRKRERIDEWQGVPILHVRPRLAGYDTFDFDSTAFFLEEGERAMREALGQPA